MSLDDLHKWRAKFDSLQIKYWKTNPNPATVRRNMTPDHKGIVPRLVFNKRFWKNNKSSNVA